MGLDGGRVKGTLGASHLVGFWPLRVGLQAGWPYGPALAAVAVDSVAWPQGRAQTRLAPLVGFQKNKKYYYP